MSPWEMETSSIPRHQVGYGWLPWALGSFLAYFGDCIIALCYRGFPGKVVKNSPANAGGAGGARDIGSLSGSGRSLGVENDNPLQYACLENPMNREAWWASQSTGSQESQTRLSEVTPISLLHPGPQQPTPPLTGAHFTAIVKHNDSYPGEKLGSIFYFIASKRTFFTFPQSAASRNKTINLSTVFGWDRWSSKETTVCQKGGINKQLYLFRHLTLVLCPQHLLVASGLNVEWGRGFGSRSQRGSHVPGRKAWVSELASTPAFPSSCRKSLIAPRECRWLVRHFLCASLVLYCI